MNFETDVVSHAQTLMSALRIGWLPLASFIWMPALGPDIWIQEIGCVSSSWAYGTDVIFDLHRNRDRTGA